MIGITISFMDLKKPRQHRPFHAQIATLHKYVKYYLKSGYLSIAICNKSSFVAHYLGPDKQKLSSRSTCPNCRMRLRDAKCVPQDGRGSPLCQTDRNRSGNLYCVS
ncbi:hypothetical protein CDAR_404961 [Caerostris darwini]|uniref:Uncharacterized protein n=1 Tax=Caerostris darwini TaxID=1538125 RepID=A0AAV4U6S1_9ARAC|nr:hypothetical protein CDAR_404961 [Caerostris darwini]